MKYMKYSNGYEGKGEREGGGEITTSNMIIDEVRQNGMI